MKIVLERRDLLAALDRVRGVIKNRNTIPIISNVMLDVGADGVMGMTCTDLDMEATASVAAADLLGTEPGQITVSANMLHDIVRKQPDGSQVSLTFTGEDPRMQVRAGRSKFNMPVLPAGDFPVFVLDNMPEPVEIEAKALTRLISLTGFAMSSEETRYYLNGVYLHSVALPEAPGAGALRMVATDGHRLAMAEMPWVHAPITGIIPRGTVREIAKLIDGAEGVTISMSPQKIVVTADGARLASKMIDGSYPDYMRVIPRDNQDMLTADTEVLKKAVDRVASISSEKGRAVKMSFEAGNLALTARNMEAGSSAEEIDVEYDGPQKDVGFNARYMLDVLSRIGSEEVEFHFADPSSPTLVLDRGDEAVKFVLMPLRV